MAVGSAIFEHWRQTLLVMHDWFVDMRARTSRFTVKALGVFFAINFTCFWWALTTTRPWLLALKPLEYVLMSVPVAALGALFDIFSLQVTLWAIARALNARSNAAYSAFLCVDLVVAVAATFWVLFAFVLSGWLVAWILPIHETLADRADLYQHRVWAAFVNPFAPDSLKNFYFGMVMGVSALIPTILHASFAVWAFARWTWNVAAVRR